MKNQRDYGTEIFNNQNKQLTSSNEQTHHGKIQEQHSSTLSFRSNKKLSDSLYLAK